jgi:hypothetical protein
MAGLGIKEVSLDCFLTLFAIALLIIEIFTTAPVIIGFLRFRCFVKFPFIYALIMALCTRKVIFEERLIIECIATTCQAN